MKKYFIFLMVFLPLLLSSCGSDEPSDSGSSLIIGSWKNISYVETDGDGNIIQSMGLEKGLLVINKDGTASDYSNSYTWSVTDNKLKLVNVLDGGVDIYPIETLTKNELVLKWRTVDANYYVVTYERVE